MELDLCVSEQLGASEDKNLYYFVPLSCKKKLVFMWELLFEVHY